VAAEEAAHFINACMRGKLKSFLSAFDLFFRNILTEALGYFGSKLINEKRKAQTTAGIRQFLGELKKRSPTAQERKKVIICRLILKHHFLEKRTRDPEEFRKKFKGLYRPQTPLFTIVSTQLGYILGSRLYYAVKQDKYSVEKVRELFADPLDGPDRAFGIYLDMARQLRNIRAVTRMNKLSSL
jgi:hypothetical protein